MQIEEFPKSGTFLRDPLSETRDPRPNPKTLYKILLEAYLSMNVALLVGNLFPLVVREAELEVVRLVGVRVVAADVTLVGLGSFLLQNLMEFVSRSITFVCL
jgi:hypothetical protein